MQVQQDEGMPSWWRFTELLNLRYGSPLRSAPLAELAECRRTGTVEEYQDQFQALLPRAGHLNEAQRSSCLWAAFNRRSASTCGSRTRKPWRLP
jgi:hypothetical protein